MFAQLRHIDFLERRVSLEVKSLTTGDRKRLRRYIGECVAMGFRTIHLKPSRALRLRERAWLREFSGACEGATILRGLWVDGGGDACSFKSRLHGRLANRPSGVDYYFSCSNLDLARRTVPQFALLVAKLSTTDRRAISKLRLALYELAVNTVEHATFSNPQPQIRIVIRTGGGCLDATYRDNAEPFVTVRNADITLAGRIVTRSKRGIGLFMLSRVADSLDFSQEGPWNCTSLALHTVETQKRSSDMQDFSLEIIPVDHKGTVVLRPKGSLDSLSTPLLEERFEAAIANAQYRIVVDLKNTDFVSSAGLGLLLGTVATLRENGGDLILMNIPDEVSDVFHIMSVDDYFRIIQRLDELATTKV